MARDVLQFLSRLVPVGRVRAQRRLGMPFVPQSRAISCGLLSLMTLSLSACGLASAGFGLPTEVTPGAISTDAPTAMGPATAAGSGAVMASPTETTPPALTPSGTPAPSSEPTVTVTPMPLPSRTAAPSPTAAASPTETPYPPPTVGAPQSPRILSFSAERVETPTDVGIRLTWHAVGEQATICPLLGEEVVGCRCLFGVPLGGSHVILPSQIIGSYSGFRLTVEDGGVRTLRYAPLAVECPKADPDWFFDDPPGICPKDAPLPSYAAAQRFEHGKMIWIEALDAYYVLLDHHRQATARAKGSSSLTSLRIIQGPLDLKPGASPSNRVEETRPPRLFEPVSGFGLVWRGEVEGTDDLRAALGWAVEPEYGFDTLYQCETSCGSSWDCYLRGPDGEVLHLYWLLHIGRFWEVVVRSG